MRRAEQIARVIDGYLGNPFAVDPEARDAAAAILSTLRVSSALRRMLDARQQQQAECFLLSVGHYRACKYTDDPKRVFTGRMLPASLASRLPRPVGDYLRVVMAAGRCYRVLAGIRGLSEVLNRVRLQTWASCFGDSLYSALRLERVIHDHDVLILGETGTGKDSFAKAIRVATPGGRDGEAAPSGAINAAALPDTLVESELFGHVKGAFTGASETRTGRLRSADGGSFFLDEVGDLPVTTQVKLLRVIETNEVYPLGSDKPEHVELRYVAATHKDLEASVQRREFRRDLFERLAGNIIRIPPLRDRPEDVLEIGLQFIASYVDTPDRDGRIEAWLGSREARNYDWPGNVRELQNVLRNLLLGLPPGLKNRARKPQTSVADEVALPPALASCSATLQSAGDWYIERVLTHCDNNFSQAAKVLGVDRSTVRRRTRRS